MVLTTAFLPHVGGAEIATQEIIARLRGQFDFVVVTARMDAHLPTRDTFHDVSVVRVGWGSAFDKWWLIIAGPWHVWRLRRTRAAGTRIGVWAVMASYAGAGAWIARRVCGVPYALMLQEGDDLNALESRLGFLRTPFHWIFRDAAAVQAIAPFLADWAKRNGARAPTEVIPNGVVTADFFIADEERATWRKKIRDELNIPTDAFVVLTVSRLVIKNGVADLISAVSELPNAHLIIVGDGGLHDELQVAATPLGERAHFMGTQSPQEIKKYAAASDVFCRPSLSEGLGIVFLEAMAMGLLVVATRVGGIPFIVSDGETGLLLAPRAPHELAGALGRVRDDAELRVRLAQNGFEQVKQFEWDALMPKFVIWLQRLFTL